MHIFICVPLLELAYGKLHLTAIALPRHGRALSSYRAVIVLYQAMGFFAEQRGMAFHERICLLDRHFTPLDYLAPLIIVLIHVHF